MEINFGDVIEEFMSGDIIQGLQHVLLEPGIIGLLARFCPTGPQASIQHTPAILPTLLQGPLQGHCLQLELLQKKPFTPRIQQTQYLF